MKEIIKNFLNKWVCCHDWDLIRDEYVTTDFGGAYHSLIFVCKKCGKFKKMKTNPG